MKRTIIASALLATGLFGAGIAVGEIGGIPGSSAATTVVTPTTTQVAPNVGSAQGNVQDTPHADGTVTAINGDTLTIAAGNDPTGTTEYTSVTAVNLTSATQYDAGHDSSGTISKSSIKVGSYVIVDGTINSDGKSITATSLRIDAGGPVPGH